MEQVQSTSEWHCRVDSSGRVFLPQSLRSQAAINAGDEFIVEIENGSITFRNYIAAMQRLQDAFAEGLPNNVSLVDELLAERQAEALREEHR